MRLGRPRSICEASSTVKIRLIGTDVHTFLKRSFYLLWLACEGTLGEGRRKDNPLADEDDVWNNVVNSGDYPSPSTRCSDHKLYADYVFGRRIKWGCIFKDDVIRFIERDPFDRNRHDFARDFESNRELADAVCKSLHCSYKILSARGIWEVTDDQCVREFRSLGVYGTPPKPRRRKRRFRRGEAGG